MLVAALGCGRCGRAAAVRLGGRRLRLRFGRGAGVGDERRLGGCAAAPVLDLRVHHRRGFGRRADRLDLIGRRNAQDRAALERVDVVLVERVRVLLEEREHQLIDVRRVVRLDLARDARERVARFDLVFAAALQPSARAARPRPGAAVPASQARGAQRRRVPLRRRRAGFRFFGRAGRVSERARARLRHRRHRGRAGRRCHDRRIEQHRVLAKQTALRPVRFDEEIEERLANTSLLVTLITMSPCGFLTSENSSGTERRERFRPTRSKSSAAASCTSRPFGLALRSPAKPESPRRAAGSAWN